MQCLTMGIFTGIALIVHIFDILKLLRNLSGSSFYVVCSWNLYSNLKGIFLRKCGMFRNVIIV